MKPLRRQLNWWIKILFDYHFDDANFTRWQDKLTFLLTVLKIYYNLDLELALLSEWTDGEIEDIKSERRPPRRWTHVSWSHTHCLIDCMIFTPIHPQWKKFEMHYRVSTKSKKKVTRNFLFQSFLVLSFLITFHLFPKYMSYKYWSTSWRQSRLKFQKLFK